MLFDDPTVIDANGTKYLVGWDKHGWFSIQHVKLYPAEDAINAKGADTVMYNGEEHCFDTIGKYPTTSLPADATSDVVELIESR